MLSTFILFVQRGSKRAIKNFSKSDVCLSNSPLSPSAGVHVIGLLVHCSLPPSLLVLVVVFPGDNVEKVAGRGCRPSVLGHGSLLLVERDQLTTTRGNFGARSFSRLFRKNLNQMGEFWGGQLGKKRARGSYFTHHFKHNCFWWEWRGFGHIFTNERSGRGIIMLVRSGRFWLHQTKRGKSEEK